MMYLQSEMEAVFVKKRSFFVLFFFTWVIILNGCSIQRKGLNVPFPDYVTPMMYGVIKKSHIRI